MGLHLRNNEPTLVIWLAYSEELCEQAVTEFQKAWDSLGDRTLSTYRFWGNHELDLAQAQDGLVVARFWFSRISLPQLGRRLEENP